MWGRSQLVTHREKINGAYALAHARTHNYIPVPKCLGGADSNTCVGDPGKMASTSACKPKREHKTLTIDQKLEILDQISSRSYTVLCKEYGIGRSTITDIKKREPALRAYKRKMTEMGVGRSAKIMKLGRDEELETALFLRFKQKREEGIPITGPIMQAKAR